MADSKQSPLPTLNAWLEQSEVLLSRIPVDLSMRQVAILLKVYLSGSPHTVKSLASELRIGKPPVCRAIDALSKAGLVRRKRSDADRRIVYLQRTVKGSVFLSDIAGALNTLQRSTN